MSSGLRLLSALRTCSLCAFSTSRRAVVENVRVAILEAIVVVVVVVVYDGDSGSWEGEWSLWGKDEFGLSGRRVSIGKERPKSMDVSYDPDPTLQSGALNARIFDLTCEG